MHINIRSIKIECDQIKTSWFNTRMSFEEQNKKTEKKDEQQTHKKEKKTQRLL